MTAPADSVDIAVAGDPARARDTIAGALAARGFALSWSDDWNGLATRGSKTKQVFLGTFALYLEVAVSVFAANGNVIVRLSRPSTGMTGGLAGRAKARNQFASLTTEVTEVFRANAVLLPPPF
jgi:hypothetical protein